MLTFDWLTEHLDQDDDPALWRVALSYILTEIEPVPNCLVEIGRCSRWLRPHQTRWTADGGFACPAGYGNGGGGYPPGLPEFDWSVLLAWNGAEWGVGPNRSLRIALRIAIPSRTRRHRQAAVHARWHTGREKEVVFYGFRKRDNDWICTASTTIG